jgi:hypothetical protein
LYRSNPINGVGKINGLRPVNTSAGQWSSQPTPSSDAPGRRIAFQSTVTSAAPTSSAGIECVYVGICACGLGTISATSSQSGP